MTNGSDSVEIEKKEETNKNYSYSNVSKLPNPKNWPGQSSILVTSSIRAPYVHYSTSNNDEKLNILPCNGEIIYINSPLFHGKILSRIRNNSFDPQDQQFSQKQPMSW